MRLWGWVSSRPGNGNGYLGTKKCSAIVYILLREQCGFLGPRAFELRWVLRRSDIPLKLLKFSGAALGKLPRDACECRASFKTCHTARFLQEYEKRLLAKDQEMKLSHEAMERMRKQISGLQGEVSYWQTTCASIKMLPAHPTDGEKRKGTGGWGTVLA